MCGIYGIVSKSCDLGDLVSGLQRLQHRGYDSWGVSFRTNLGVETIKCLGVVPKKVNRITKLTLGMGHIRYSTSGYNEIQPLDGKFSLVHNGNIPNIIGYDTEYIRSVIESKLHDGIESALRYIMDHIVVSYSLLVMYKDSLYVLRDRYGIRPLFYAKKNGEVHISSETCGFVGCSDVTEVNPGEILEMSLDGIRLVYSHSNARYSLCAFELLYFMKPESCILGTTVCDIRKQLGKKLVERETFIESNSDYIVIGVPESGIIAARSYARCMGLVYIQYITRISNERTFILGSEILRGDAASKKFAYDKLLYGKKVIIVDDTIVRGNVIKEIIRNLRVCGVMEIHIRIPAPKVIDINELGIAIHTKDSLFMVGKSNEEAVMDLGVNSLIFLELSDLSMFPRDSYKQCFDGKKITG